MVPGEFGHIPEYQEVTGTPREVYGPYWAIVGERIREPRRGPPSPIRIGCPPLSFPFSPLPSSPNPTREGGNPTPGGSRTPLGRAIEGPTLPLLQSFVYGGGVTP